jgi:ATP-dependent Clp protease ATP-binding subunit ClpA
MLQDVIHYLEQAVPLHVVVVDEVNQIVGMGNGVYDFL